ncbi:hypothetical protein RJ55_05268 [Drechmeria coniospora]|nr:hypothetical protein RJ55_05268 [Drechmeria coniospora]
MEGSPLRLAFALAAVTEKTTQADVRTRPRTGKACVGRSVSRRWLRLHGSHCMAATGRDDVNVRRQGIEDPCEAARDGRLRRDATDGWMPFGSSPPICVVVCPFSLAACLSSRDAAEKEDS